MLHRTLPVGILALLGLCGLTACSRDEPQEQTPAAQVEPAAQAPAPPAPVVSASDWDPAALELAQALADKVRAGGIECAEYEVVPFGMYLEDYTKVLRLPADTLPTAETYCTSAAGTEQEEDLTFIVFARPGLGEKFVEAKRKLLCRRAKEMKLHDFPGFPYVLGDRWLVQPDERTTAVALAPILGGTAAMAECDGAPAPQE